jgi:hypothetical protein
MKHSILLIAIISIVLTSCGGSGWSCKKRYCEVKKTETFKEIKNVHVEEVVVCP